MKPILVVDDDPDIRETLQIVLEVHGYAVRTASDGRQALAELVREPQPCLVLLDLMMPEMNGWEFMAAQRADPRVAGVAVVVLSGDRGVSEMAEAHGLPWLEKPVHVVTLIAMVKRLCP